MNASGLLLGALLWACAAMSANAAASHDGEQLGPLSLGLSAETPSGSPSSEAPQQLAALEKTFESQGAQRTYYEFAPALTAEHAAPLLVVLHGSGGRGNGIIKPWLALAAQQEFVIVAPNSTDIRFWKLHDDSPAMFRDLVLAVAAAHAIDTRRIYLFGQSAGAVYALTLSALESEFFAATAIHAGAWRERREFEALRFAKRKIPIAIFVGNRDPFFSVGSVRQTEAALKQAGHPVLITIIARHDHDYLDVADQVNPAAWDFMQGVSLPGNARFQEYE
ncbi:MAG TPA: PHB depolymerase family esterase [Steroidobacteraceae bacterium]|jgi:poly(3-hydroxybutyrate) depolymerase